MMTPSIGPFINFAKRLRKSFRRSKFGRWVRKFLGISVAEGSSRFNVLEELRPYLANSGGRYKARAAVTLQAAQEIFPALERIGEDSAAGSKFELWLSEGIADVGPASETLRDSLTAHGSDKATTHDYHRIYGFLLPDFPAVHKILEIGLGSTDKTIVSNMGKGGTPGASVRALRDCYPNAEVIGLEFDSEILFRENRISTYFVDQTRPDTFSRLNEVVGGEFDLMIDDGLHAPHANIFSLAFFLPRLRVGGFAVIEDISEHSVLVWKVVSRQLPASFRGALIQLKGAWVFVVQRTE